VIESLGEGGGLPTGGSASSDSRRNSDLEAQRADQGSADNVLTLLERAEEDFRSAAKGAAQAAQALQGEVEVVVENKLKDMNLTRTWVRETLDNARACVAVLLPGTQSPFDPALFKGNGSLRRMLSKRVRVRAVADTTFSGTECRLWLLDFDARGTGQSVQVQFRVLRQSIEEATQSCKPTQGPWIWPLHDHECSLALLSEMESLREDRVPTLRKFLWALRLVSLPDGARSSALLHKHYGNAVAYAFAWSNLYVKGLWMLLSFCVICSIPFGSAGPADVGTELSVPWHLLQFITLLWARLMADEGSSQRFVLRHGGEAEVPVGAQAAQEGAAKVGKYDTEALRADRAAAKERDTKHVAKHVAATAVAEEEPARQHNLAALKLWECALVASRFKAQNALLHKQYNWDHQPLSEASQKRRRILLPVLEVVVLALFCAVAIAVLALFVQLNVYNAFVWGRCLEPEVRERAAALGQECRDPQFVHGFSGWLAEVGSDIGLAILFDVALGEAAKAMARGLVSLRNYKFEKDKRYHELMLQLGVEAISKVGMFAIVGFFFLPRWGRNDAYQPGHVDNVFDAVRHCGHLWDFQICSAFAGEARCSDTLSCIAQRLDFVDRRAVLEKAVKGPFVVAPFVRILVTVVIPWFAAMLEEAVTKDTRDASSSRLGGSRMPKVLRGVRHCMRVAFTPIARILGLIFPYDGDSVGGCGFVARGWPFGPLRPVDTADPLHRLIGFFTGGREEAKQKAKLRLQSSLLQVARKEFEPFAELLELKMNFLFVLFFAPIMPFGLLPTLIARILEVRFKSTKLFFVRRRCWPSPAEILHTTQKTFSECAVALAVAWHVGLVLVTYNRDVASLGAGRIIGIWLGAAAGANLLLAALSFLLRRGWHLAVRRSQAAKVLGRPEFTV